jgi:hypothetical protein
MDAAGPRPLLRDFGEGGLVDGHDDDLVWRGKGTAKEEQEVQPLQIEKGEGGEAGEGEHGHEGGGGDDNSSQTNPNLPTHGYLPAL